jgi:hypothetical protein
MVWNEAMYCGEINRGVDMWTDWNVLHTKIPQEIRLG